MRERTDWKLSSDSHTDAAAANTPTHNVIQSYKTVDSACTIYIFAVLSAVDSEVKILRPIQYIPLAFFFLYAIWAL